MRVQYPALLLGVLACGPGPVLMSPTPAPLGTFSLADSTEVVRRVHQIFSCAASPGDLPFGTLGWRRDSGFVDITVVQAVPQAGGDAATDRACFKGFRVDANGRIFVLPEKDWPYTSFRKQPPSEPRL